MRALTLLNPRMRYHRASIRQPERIPSSGGAVIVSNHGRLDFDSFLLLRLLLQSRGRLARLMADHMWFKLPFTSGIFTAAGAVDGTRENAHRLLEQGDLVLTYPGGVREIFGGRFGREHLDWEGRHGFALVAIRAGAPVIPVVGLGVNNGLVFLTSGRILGALLFRGVFRLGAAYADYPNPLALGLLPLPLPMSMAVALPLPCRLTYIVGEPIVPPQPVPGESELELAARFASDVEAAMRALIGKQGKVS
jgi:1-acyl-sn-glycerol-3-phosphate acyltransferase